MKKKKKYNINQNINQFKSNNTNTHFCPFQESWSQSKEAFRNENDTKSLG